MQKVQTRTEAQVGDQARGQIRHVRDQIRYQMLGFQREIDKMKNFHKEHNGRIMGGQGKHEADEKMDGMISEMQQRYNQMNEQMEAGFRDL